MTVIGTAFSSATVPENEVESEKASFTEQIVLVFAGFAKIQISPRLLGVGS